MDAENGEGMANIHFLTCAKSRNSYCPFLGLLRGEKGRIEQSERSMEKQKTERKKKSASVLLFQEPCG